MTKTPQLAIVVSVGIVACSSGSAAQAGIATIALAGDPVPEGNGQFASFTDTPVLNAAGDVAFPASLQGTSGGTLDDSGIYLRAIRPRGLGRRVGLWTAMFACRR